MTAPRDVLDFWFKEIEPKAWFTNDPAFDEKTRSRFLDDVTAARAGQHDDWIDTPEGSLALLILLDQFPRNLFRGTADAFASDAKARDAARHAIDKGFDLETPHGIRQFFYMPLMHSEDMADQSACVELSRERRGADSDTYSYAVKHRDVIARFGRFPGRNAALGRTSTEAETEYLQSSPPF
jgi:uncharacterized protein (DUF924 family)